LGAPVERLGSAGTRPVGAIKPGSGRWGAVSSAKTCALTESRPSQRSWSGLAKISIGCPSQRSIARLSNKKPLRSLIQPPADSFGNSPCHFPMVGSQAEQTAEVCRRRADQ
jgi:hypothetical protein